MLTDNTAFKTSTMINRTCSAIGINGSHGDAVIPVLIGKDRTIFDRWLLFYYIHWMGENWSLGIYSILWSNDFKMNEFENYDFRSYSWTSGWKMHISDKISYFVCSLMSVSFALERHGTNRKHGRASSDQIFESPDDVLKPLPRFNKIQACKVGCIFAIVISSESSMEQYRDDDHREDAPHFRI